MDIEPQGIMNVALITVCIIGSVFLLLATAWATRNLIMVAIREVSSALVNYIMPDEEEEEEKTS